MDPLLLMLQPAVVSAMTLCPIVLQYVRRFLPAFSGAHAGLTNAGIVVAVVGWTVRPLILHPTPANLLTFATQAAVAVLLSDMWFNRAVAPLSASSNPLIPNPTEGGK